MGGGASKKRYKVAAAEAEAAKTKSLDIRRDSAHGKYRVFAGSTEDDIALVAPTKTYPPVGASDEAGTERMMRIMTIADLASLHHTNQVRDQIGFENLPSVVELEEMDTPDAKGAWGDEDQHIAKADSYADELLVMQAMADTLAKAEPKKAVPKSKPPRKKPMLSLNLVDEDDWVNVADDDEQEAVPSPRKQKKMLRRPRPGGLTVDAGNGDPCEAPEAMPVDASFRFTQSGALDIDEFEPKIRECGIQLSQTDLVFGASPNYYANCQSMRSMRIISPSVELSQKEEAQAAFQATQLVHAQRALKMHERFVRLYQLGEGASGQVHKALDIVTMKLVALKDISVFDQSKRKQMLHELSLLYGALGQTKQQPATTPMHQNGPQKRQQHHPSLSPLLESPVGGGARLSLEDITDVDEQKVTRSNSRLLQPGSVASPVNHLSQSAGPDTSSSGGVKRARSMSAVTQEDDSTQFRAERAGFAMVQLHDGAEARDERQRVLGTASGEGHVVSFFDAFAWPLGEMKVTLMVEYMDGGSLQDLVDAGGCQAEELLASMMRQGLLGLRFLHEEKKVLHRDIKPANMLIDSRNHVKLSDFGLAKGVEADSNCQTFIGTTTYMSPERLSGSGYSHPADVWSLGLTLMSCAMGRFPFSASEGFWGIMQQVTEGNLTDKLYEEKDEAEAKAEAKGEAKGAKESSSSKAHRGKRRRRRSLFSPSFKDLLDQCLKKEPQDRMDCSKLLAHPFLLKYPPKESSAVKGGTGARGIGKGPAAITKSILAGSSGVDGVDGDAGLDQRALAELQRIRDKLYQQQLPFWPTERKNFPRAGGTDLPHLITAERLDYLNLVPLAEQLGMPEHLVRHALMQTVRETQRAAASPSAAW
jgi:serine/threonine protein kinase